MSDPLVTAICLTRDRPEMLARAVKCFRAQRYTPRMLLVFDTSGNPRYPDEAFGGQDMPETPDSTHGYLLYIHSAPFSVIHRPSQQASVGELRNRANTEDIAKQADILVHWDDDDWSHPNRMAEQVALLQTTGAEAVGYKDCLFWREAGSGRDLEGTSRGCPLCVTLPCQCDGQAWLYRAGKPNYAVGTSLMYWRKTWEARRFPDLSVGEDTAWQHFMKVRVASSISRPYSGPRIVATIHGGNTGMTAYGTLLKGVSEQFRRAYEWDSYCEKLFSAGRNASEQLGGDPASEAGAHQVDAAGNRPGSQDE